MHACTQGENAQVKLLIQGCANRSKVQLKSSENRQVVVSYWSGDLPKNAVLHFESFFAVNPGVEYHLYLENCAAESTRDLQEFTVSSQLRIIDFKILDWLELFQVPRIHRQSALEKVLTLPLKVVGWVVSRRQLGWLFQPMRKIFGSWFHLELGFTPPHNSRFSDYSSDLAYISDIFRCLAPSIYEETDYWYFDLDVAFLKPLDRAPAPAGRSYVSQWGASDFANSAIFHVSRTDSSLRSALVSKIQRGTLAKPWVIFSKSSCSSLGLHILPVSYTDPPWAQNNPFTGDSRRFFSNPPLSIEELKQIAGFTYFHWHGMWGITPDDSSPFEQLLSLAREKSKSSASDSGLVA